ncbi:uncharacterized protein LOC100837705 isoform X4 [Brachypodium distachyon]|uniref:Uncharacterized protein n=1 Tax=Brachypodium distachyon TaxID=15368 RepID=A0A0Q3F8I6_BRADI|nr:uncharacterized protein LOC100837705 isoform X4 [Brachypodium distachyon]KQJ96095.1 hypothetical protein BRADI_3g20952v3 [Brachypodium distachyon]|eukprot:XP_003573721.2 uncharacterized protein LOC100837705 isoform X4 [Brachypodium distachyon]
MASGGAIASASGGTHPSTSGGAGAKTVATSLWWDPFVDLSDDLDRAAASPSTPISDALAERIKDHHAWFRGAVSMFAKPNEASRRALDAGQVAIGTHCLAVKPDLKKAALRMSKCLNLDEVQSYILVKRSLESTPMTHDADAEELLRLVSLQYYLERQCLLKCIRRIFVHATCTDGGSDSTDAIKEEASLLISEDIERRLLSITEDSLAAAFSVKGAADLTVSWLEESLIEINLILDIVFLAIYDNFSRCNTGLWITLCSIFKDMISGSYDVAKFAVSVEAKKSFHHAKAQLLFVLIESLDFENLLRMVHDEVSFSGGYSTYSVVDILEMDIEVSKLPEFAVESGPLILAWAVFLCLVLSLPGSNTNLEIDHASYAQRAFELAPFNYLLGVLCSSIFRESDGPVSGFRGVLRTFISAFIASYEISYQTEDSSLEMILNILCQIYGGEESLCMQFWDKDSFVDGPIRSVLHMVEKEYPFQISDLLRFLSAVCHGTWPAQCVYNYLERINGVTTLYAIPSGVPDSVKYCDQIEIHHPMNIPGMEGIILPCGTHGYILRVLQDDVALVRWEFPHSGVFILLVTLAQDLYSCNYVEACDIMDLLYQMVLSNKDLCCALVHADKSLVVEKSKNLGHIGEHVRIDVIKILCTSILKYVQDGNNATIMAKTFRLLTEFLKCVPCRMFDMGLECGIFTSQLNGSSSDWLLSGALARMLFAASEENGDCSSLTTSLLDFAIQVLRNGAAADDMISPFIVFSIQYIMVNHMSWKYRKSSRWRTTLKVFELVKRCIQLKSFSSKLGGIVWQILLYDSSIHSILWHILSMSTQLLEHSHGSYHNCHEDIEDIQLVLCCGFDIIFFMLSNLPEGLMPVPPFVTMVLSSSLKPFPFVAAAISSMSFQNSAIQVAAARAFSILCFTAHSAQAQLMENCSFIIDGSEIWRLQASISHILEKEESINNYLIVGVFNLLTSIARYQPALFVSLTEQNTRVEADRSISTNSQINIFSPPIISRSNGDLVEKTLGYIAKSTDLLDRSPSLLLSVLNLLEALWESGVQFTCILDKLRSSIAFWENLSQCIRASLDHCPVESVDEKFSLRYNCQRKILEIMSHELFLKGKLVLEEKPSNPILVGTKERAEPSSKSCPSNVVLKWFDSALVEDFVNNLSCNGYQKELLHDAKVASCICIIRLIMNLSSGDTGSLSFSAVKKVQLISSKLLQHRAFLALLSQYALHGYSDEQELTKLVISDLYYHIHGELEGRPITPGPFQELLCFLLELRFFERNPSEQPRNTFQTANGNFLFDVARMRDELGVDLWSHSDWKPCKVVADKMLDIMHKANLMKSHADAKLCTLRSFITFLSVYIGTSTNNKLDLPDGGISATTTRSAIRYACKSFQSTVDLLFPEVDTNEVLFPLLSGQVELLLTLTRILFHQAKQTKSFRDLHSVIVILMKTAGASISFLVDLMPASAALKKPVKALLVLLLSLFEFIYVEDDMKDESGDVNLFGESSLISTKLLPVLCKLAENKEYSELAIGSMDLILKGVLPPHVWVPILQKHFCLQAILHKCQNGVILSTQVILNFLLTLGRTKDGAKILQSANIFAFLKVLLSQLSLDDSCYRNSLSTQAKDVNLWGLGLAIVASLNHCMDDDISRNSVANSTINFLSGQVPLMSSYLSAQSVNTHQNKKRAPLQQPQTSLSALSLTENILTLLCILAKYHFPRDTSMMEVDSELREIIIHLLAFISRGTARTGDSPNWNPSFFCPPTGKEELLLHEDPPLIRSKYGWFKFAASSALSTAVVSAPSNTSLSLVIRDKSAGDSDSVKQTRFTEMMAVQVYRIAFLIMKFLCSQAKEAVKRAEELEFLDLAHFPELPMPDILHGLQDQVVSIVTEVLQANGSSSLGCETDRLCHFLLVILETSLYMELCVSQSCGIRPVLGRFEDFSKGIKAMLHALEKHSNFKPLVRSLTQIATLLYPGLSQSSIIM